jgi:Uma2 family endonuclease
MSTAFKILPHYTYEDWLQWEGKWELIDGIPFAMSPAPVPQHQRIAAELNYIFITALKKSGCKKCKVYQPIDYKIAEDTILEPDVLIVCDNIEKKFLDFPPALVVEILSPSTALKDRNTKYELYQQQLVKYYLIVDPDKEQVEIYKLTGDKYQMEPFEKSCSFYLEEGCSIEVQLNEIW